jgi:hypothetical protein
MVCSLRYVLPRGAADAVPHAAGLAAALQIVRATDEQKQRRENKEPVDHAGEALSKTN